MEGLHIRGGTKRNKREEGTKESKRAFLGGRRGGNKEGKIGMERREGKQAKSRKRIREQKRNVVMLLTQCATTQMLRPCATSTHN